MPQDFSRRFIIVVRKDLPSWQVLNTIAHASAALASRLKLPFDTGDFFITKDGAQYPRNSLYPIIALSADSAEQLRALLIEVRKQSLEHIGFIREMIDFTDDAELQTQLSQKNDVEIELLGVGIFGDNAVLKSLTKKFSLWK
jgi:hypothetical protein